MQTQTIPLCHPAYLHVFFQQTYYCGSEVIRNSLPFLVSSLFTCLLFIQQVLPRHSGAVLSQAALSLNTRILRRKPHRQLGKSVLGAARQKCAEK